jgi:hypothetical protein
VSDDGLSQIESAVGAEIAAVAEFRPELLGRVSSLARPTECQRMVRARREKQRSESNEQHHDARIVVRKARACQVGRRNSLVESVDSVDNSDRRDGSFHRGGVGPQAHGATPIAQRGKVVATKMPHALAIAY